MATLAIPNRIVPWLRTSAAIAVIIACLSLFGPFYVPGVLTQMPFQAAIDPMSPAMMQTMRGLFFHSLFFAQPGRYLVAGLLAVGLLLAVVFLARPGRLMRVLLGLSLLGVVAVPWVYSYQPAVSAAPGYRVLVATQPGLIEGVTKRTQQFAEVRPCDYSLLGWSSDDTLYYREQCRGDDARVMAVSPARGGSARSVEGVPPDLSAERKQPVVDGVRSPTWTRGPDGRLVESAEAERNSIRIRLREGGLVSPSSEWVAVVARHIYGPEDVLVLSKDAGTQ